MLWEIHSFGAPLSQGDGICGTRAATALRFLFAGFTPLSIQVAIENLQPMTIHKSRRRSQSDPRSLFFPLGGGMFLSQVLALF